MKGSCSIGAQKPFLASAKGIERWNSGAKSGKDEEYNKVAIANWPQTVAIVEKATPGFSKLNLPKMSEPCGIRTSLLRFGRLGQLGIEPGAAGVYVSGVLQETADALTGPRLVDPFVLKVCNLLLGMWRSQTARKVLKRVRTLPVPIRIRLLRTT